MTRPIARIRKNPALFSFALVGLMFQHLVLFVCAPVLSICIPTTVVAECESCQECEEIVAYDCETQEPCEAVVIVDCGSQDSCGDVQLVDWGSVCPAQSIGQVVGCEPADQTLYNFTVVVCPDGEPIDCDDCVDPCRCDVRVSQLQATFAKPLDVDAHPGGALSFLQSFDPEISIHTSYRFEVEPHSVHLSISSTVLLC
jgi:hypothetical protein